MAVVSNLKVKFASLAYSRREAELTYEGRLTIAGDESHQLSDVSRVKFRRRGSSVDVKMLFSDGSKLTIRFYGECAYLVTNKGRGHEEPADDDDEDRRFARLFGLLLANEHQDAIGIYDDPFEGSSMDLLSLDDSCCDLDETGPLFQTPLRSRREPFVLPVIHEFPVHHSHVQDGIKDVELMRRYVVGEISVADEIVLSWLPGLIDKDKEIQ